jgi:hypothetical protein
MLHRVGDPPGPARPVPNPSRNWSSKVRLLQTTRTLHQDKEGWQRNFVPGTLLPAVESPRADHGEHGSEVKIDGEQGHQCGDESASAFICVHLRLKTFEV